MGDAAIPAEAMRLRAFLGDWTVSGAIEAEGTTSAISGRWRFEPAVDGWGVRDHRGDWVTDDELEVVYEGWQEGRRVREVITVTFQAPGRSLGHILEHADGQLVLTTDVAMSRDA